MILARVHTNVDPPHPGWRKRFEAYFPDVPTVGQTIFWNDWRMKIIDVGWEEDKTAGKYDPHYRLVVEFNK